MSDFEIYAFLLCLIVFVMLTGAFTFMIAKISNLTLRVIKSGLDDKKIKNEYINGKNKLKAVKVLDVAFSLIVCIALLVAFAFSLYVNLSEDSYFENTPTMRVVKSSSMSKKYSTNTHLFKNNLDNQFDMFDVIFVYKAPEESELKLYDIVVYEIDGVKLVHRIVGIEEPNESHPNERHFLLQGDAVDRPDKFPVRYSQIEAIYRDEKIPFIGSFICFMQSPAGWLCVLLVVFAIISSFIIEIKLKDAKRIRLEAMGFMLPLYEWEHR